MHRFFVSPHCIDGDAVALSGPVARQLARVLRSRPGDQIVVLDDSGWEHLVTLQAVDPDVVRGAVTERRPSSGEPGVEITIYQGVLKGDRFELALQKGTELGVSAFVPTFCARSVPRRTDDAWAAGRYTRWRRILTEAAEQSGRGKLPTLREPVTFAAACDEVEGMALIPWEEEQGEGIRMALASWKREDGGSPSISVFIGPEGGFTLDEIEYARARGIQSVGLGNRTLRAETAGLAAVTAIMYELGELGG